MFGYIRPLKSELLVREYEEYKAVYCQLCRVLGDSLGVGTRFTLSYDATLYALVAIAVNGSAVPAKEKHCTVNPAKKCKFIASSGTEYEKAAALSIMMTYYKFYDNIEDDSFSKSVVSRMGLPYLSQKYKKAKAQYPDMAEIVSSAMKDQAEIEATENPSLDACCEPTANMLALLMEELGHGDKMLAVPLKQFGYFLGRWVYLMDASDDLADDLKSGSFNPLVQKLSLQSYVGKKQSEAFSGEVRQKAETFCNEALNANLANLLPAINLISFQQFAPIIENIVQKGLPQVQKEILFLHVKDRKRKKEPH
ncbi:DUF5685 family protein [Scatolibacter rhodanostii]|uniref:DUF5685 family protein n=1 Tax=Scatolibacter rhodanostii TaxID=2014781 RepID=UPI000C06CD36|nr:DUF5685 family protein [Scatolibacter rhodanostii]